MTTDTVAPPKRPSTTGPYRVPRDAVFMSGIRGLKRSNWKPGEEYRIMSIFSDFFMAYTAKFEYQKLSKSEWILVDFDGNHHKPYSAREK